MRLARGIVVSIAVLVAVQTIRPQQVDCQRRTFAVNVTTPEGKAVAGLAVDNFSGSVHHKPVKIVSVTPNASPPRVFLVIDASGSMTGSRIIWKYYMDVADWFLGSVPKGSTVGLAVFTSEIKKLIPLSQDLEPLKDELKKLRSEDKEIFSGVRKTSLWDTLNDVHVQMSPPNEGDAIYVLTDGIDTSSKVPMKTVVNELLGSGIRIFSFTIEDSGGPANSIEYAEAFNVFEGLPERSGGSAELVWHDDHDLLMPLRDKRDRLSPEGKAVSAQFDQVLNYLVLDVDLPVKLEKPENWTLKTRNLHVKEPFVSYPQILLPCTATPGTPRPAN